jgi:Domain of unknown function (DUF4129)
MRPERLERINPWVAKRLAVLGASLFALIMLSVLAGVARAAESGASSSTAPIYDSASFIHELGRLKAGLDGAGNSTETLRAYRESLPVAWSVDAGGHHFDVPTDALTTRLKRAESEPKLRDQQLKEARDYLDSLTAETAALSGQSPPQTDSARTKLNAILAHSEYSHVQKQTWWQQIRGRITEILLNALDRILRNVGGQKSLGYILLWIGVCSGAILIAYWVFRNWFRTARAQEMALSAAAVPALSWQEWVFGAREAAGRGDYRMAVHCAYWAGIARLQDAGTLTPDRAKTPREYLQALSKAKLLMPETLATRHDALSLLTARLERTWYGSQIATESDFRDSLTQLEILGCPLP